MSLSAPPKKSKHSELEVFNQKMAALAATAAPPEKTAGEGQPDGAEQAPQADALLALTEKMELWHDSDGDGFATLEQAGHNEHWRLNLKPFRYALANRFWLEQGKAPSAQAMQNALGVLEGKARFEGKQRTTAVRLAEADGTIYLDVANEAWQVIAISAAGWSVSESRNCPIKFIRRPGELALPLPTRGGKLRDLKDTLRIKSDDTYILVAAWLVAALRPGKPIPILNVEGEQGSGKSTLCRMLKSLLDPNVAPLRSLPRDERDMTVAARSSLIVGYDNLSGLPPAMSDALCRLATGAGFATRALYTDGDESIFSGVRPVLLNGIDAIGTRADLMDRSIIITMPTIPELERATESSIWLEFQAAHPGLLGAIFDAVVLALANLEKVALPRSPRMADFAQLAIAAEPALEIPEGNFVKIYEENRLEVGCNAIDFSPPMSALLDYLDVTGSFEGSLSDLFGLLEERAAIGERKPEGWPKSPNRLSSILRRTVPVLRMRGYAVTFSRSAGRDRGRRVMIERLGKGSSGSSGSSETSKNPQNQTFLSDATSDATSDAPPPTVRTKTPAKCWFRTIRTIRTIKPLPILHGLHQKVSDGTKGPPEEPTYECNPHCSSPYHRRIPAGRQRRQAAH